MLKDKYISIHIIHRKVSTRAPLISLSSLVRLNYLILETPEINLEYKLI